MIGALVVAVALAGRIPAAVGPAQRVTWINADGLATACSIEMASRWSCEIDEPPPGLVLVVGVNHVAYVSMDRSGERSDPVVRRWGRLLLLSPATDPAELDGVRISGWRPDRAPRRPKVRRFNRVEEQIDTLRLGVGSFWIAGDDGDPDAFVAIDGPGVAEIRLAIGTLKTVSPDELLRIALMPGHTMTGRVENNAHRDVANAEVELFERLAITDEPEPSAAAPIERVPLVLRARARSADDGGVAFDRLAPGQYVVVAFDSENGRGTGLVRSVLEPFLIRLQDPATVTGRVVFRRQPVAAALVRFIPAANAFRDSADAADVMTEDVSTGSDGRFMLRLPPRPEGSIQVTSREGLAVRVPIAAPKSGGQLVLGDVALPEPRRVVVRVLDPSACILRAVGPLGLGLSIIQATPVPGNIHWFDVPEPGQWVLDADCGAGSIAVRPNLVDVPPSGPEIVVGVQLRR